MQTIEIIIHGRTIQVSSPSHDHKSKDELARYIEWALQSLAKLELKR